MGGGGTFSMLMLQGCAESDRYFSVMTVSVFPMSTTICFSCH